MMNRLLSFLLLAFAVTPLFARSHSSNNGLRLIAKGATIHRFFDTSPISPSGKYIALFRFPYESHSPIPGDTGDVIVIDLKTGKEVYSTPTRGWEMQLGANVQWGKTDKQLYYNDVDTKTWLPYAVEVDFRTGHKRRCAGTVFMASPDGKSLLSYNLVKSRLAQVGYGVVIPDSLLIHNIGPVSNDGLYLTNLKTNTCKMIASIADIYQHTTPSIKIDDPQNYEYYCFQVKWNPQCTRLLTTIQWTPLTGGERRRAVITMKPDGTDMHTAITPDQWAKGGHHVNWMPDGVHLSMNLNIDGKPGNEIISVRYDGTELKQIYPVGSGHPSANPRGIPYMVTDAYPYEMNLPNGMIPIRIINLKDQTEYHLAEVYLPPITNFEFRVDAHPAWTRDGRKVVFNALVDSTRSVYIADFKEK